MGKHGIPDIVGCMPVTITPDMVGRRVGLFFGVETKALGRRSQVSELQRDQLDEIAAAGGTAEVVDAVSQMDGAFANYVTGH